MTSTPSLCLDELSSPFDKVSSDDAFDLSKLPSSTVLPDPVLNFPSSTPRFLSVEFQWFLIALSVLPGNSLAIDAHLFPWIAWAETIIRSSSAVAYQVITYKLFINL